MILLKKELEKKLLLLSNAEKEKVGNRIVLALGGDPKKTTNLNNKRRGNADGGIDGRITVYADTELNYNSPNGEYTYKKKKERAEFIGAINVKLESRKFSRSHFHTFVQDMKRENIFHGIIISAEPLAPDAEDEMKRINNNQEASIEHFLVEDLLSKTNLECKFSFNIPLKKALKNSIEKL